MLSENLLSVCLRSFPNFHWREHFPRPSSGTVVYSGNAPNQADGSKLCFVLLCAEMIQSGNKGIKGF